MTAASPLSHKARIDAIREAYDALQEAESLRLAGELDRALAVCADLVARYPDHWAARHTLGLIHQDLQNYDEALGHLLRATILNPKSTMSLTALAGVCLVAGAVPAAVATMDRACAMAPDDANVQFMRGECLRADGRLDLAADAYREAIKTDASLHTAIYKLGLCLLELGRRSEAIALLREANRLDPTLLGPLYELTTFHPDESGLDALPLLEALQKPPHMPADVFALSKLFGASHYWLSQKNHEAAWTHLVAANRAADAQRRARARMISASQIESLARVAETGRLPLAPLALDQPVSLFILGSSRSGKTTVESLLAAQTFVKRGFETSIVQDSIQHVMQENGLLPVDTAGLLPIQLKDAFAAEYSARLRSRCPDAKVFTNTNPTLISDAAKLLSIVANAKIIFIKRDVADTCLRIYAQEYEAGNDYAYNLNSIREHVIWYHQMIDSLHALYPDVTRILHYEDVVCAPQAALQAASGLCGAPFDATPDTQADDRGCSQPYRAWMALEAVRSPA